MADIEEIYAGMFTVPTIQNIRDFDMIICNKPLITNTAGQPPAEGAENTFRFSGVQCKNYRAVKYGTGDLPPNLYIRIGSIDLNSMESEVPLNYYLNNYCERVAPEGSTAEKIAEIAETNRIIDLGSGGKTIYFKGAYTRFPSSWQDLPRDAFNQEPLKSKLKIFEKATQSIFVNILPILEKIGFRTIVVDPEPGFHPNTIGMTDEEKKAGLIGIYQKMGLKKINCKIRKVLLELHREDFRTIPIEDLRVESRLPLPPNFDQLVMVGDIQQLNDKFRGFIFDSAVSSVRLFGEGAAKLAGIDPAIIHIDNAKHVPIKFIRDYDFPDYLDETTFNTLRTNTTNNIQKRFEQKYLKYKQKYLALKSKLL